MTALDTAPAPEQASLFEDFIDIFFAPAKVYARRATSGFGAAFVIVALLMAILGFVNAGSMQAVMDAEMDRAMAQALEQNPTMSEEQQAAMAKVMNASAKYGKYAVVIVMPVMLLVVGTVVWLVGKVFGGALNWGTGMVIAVYAYVPRILESVLVAVQALLLDTSGYTSRFSYSLGVGRFVDPSGPQGILNFVGRIDVFTIWTTVLIGIGLMVAGKLSKGKAIAAATTVWVIGGLPALPGLLKGK